MECCCRGVRGEAGRAQAKLPGPKLPPVSLRIFPVPGPIQTENLEVRMKDVYKTYPMG